MVTYTLYLSSIGTASRDEEEEPDIDDIDENAKVPNLENNNFLKAIEHNNNAKDYNIKKNQSLKKKKKKKKRLPGLSFDLLITESMLEEASDLSKQGNCKIGNIEGSETTSNSASKAFNSVSLFSNLNLFKPQPQSTQNLNTKIDEACFSDSSKKLSSSIISLAKLNKLKSPITENHQKKKDESNSRNFNSSVNLVGESGHISTHKLITKTTKDYLKPLTRNSRSLTRAPSESELSSRSCSYQIYSMIKSSKIKVSGRLNASMKSNAVSTKVEINLSKPLVSLSSGLTSLNNKHISIQSKVQAQSKLKSPNFLTATTSASIQKSKLNVLKTSPKPVSNLHSRGGSIHKPNKQELNKTAASFRKMTLSAMRNESKRKIEPFNNNIVKI